MPGVTLRAAVTSVFLVWNKFTFNNYTTRPQQRRTVGGRQDDETRQEYEAKHPEEMGLYPTWHEAEEKLA